MHARKIHVIQVNQVTLLTNNFRFIDSNKNVWPLPLAVVKQGSTAMARKNFKKKQVDTSVGVLKAHLEEMKPSGPCNTFILAAFVLVVAVCVVPLAALSNCK